MNFIEVVKRLVEGRIDVGKISYAYNVRGVNSIRHVFMVKRDNVYTLLHGYVFKESRSISHNPELRIRLVPGVSLRPRNSKPKPFHFIIERASI